MGKGGLATFSQVVLKRVRNVTGPMSLLTLFLREPKRVISDTFVTED